MSSPQSQAQRDRQAARERAAQMRRQQRAQERRRSVLVWSGVVAVVIVIAAAVALTIAREQANKPSLADVRSYTPPQGHVEGPVKYPQTPPAGGEHAPVWLNCGVYTNPVPNENAVHSLEHGAMWVTYRPDLAAPQVAKLRQALPETYAVLSPYPGLPAPVVVSAWGRQLTLTGADDARLAAFTKEFRLGPQVPEPGAACTGGIGSPANPSVAP